MYLLSNKGNSSSTGVTKITITIRYNVEYNMNIHIKDRDLRKRTSLELLY